ncbi:MAG: HAD-IA family hydrolase [Aliidiomarina sp.]|uniref:HAD-IA family hydrolase n=1 Tax=Aliidiomarina sp. TaxID=1872439 RepID=UPI0025BC1479|nr:HAD-IA family hydrolase [Aliidiomarina sp.]MCH8500644.1 HAD-IA family hydrolase [Aliidiomarina sp.]
MWQFYRRLQPFSIISFDLDDTLYNNKPVMLRAEQHLAAFVARQCPEVAHLDAQDWRQLRNQVAAAHAELASDMTALREATLTRGLQAAGVKQVASVVASAMEEFLHVRNEVSIRDDVHQLLQRLASHYPLVAVSNGNADIRRLGLEDYFQAAWRPGQGMRGKPYGDMFAAAQQHFQLTSPQQILHIGDHPVSDVEGALRFGAQAIWYQPTHAIAETQRARWLPTASIEDLDALYQLID